MIDFIARLPQMIIGVATDIFRMANNPGVVALAAIGATVAYLTALTIYHVKIRKD